MPNIPLEITIRDLPRTDAIQTKITQKFEKLTRFYEHINFCKVIIEKSQNHKHQGKLFSVKIEVGVPGKLLVVTHKINEDLYVAIRDAFAAMQRQVEDYARKQRGNVKLHAEPLSGLVTRLFADYGFIATADGKEYYFHQSNLLQPAFAKLNVGTPVYFLDNGVGDSLQASHVSSIVTNTIT